MKNSYFLNKNEKQIGPLTGEQILEKIKTKELSWMDYIFEESKKDWILLMEHKNFNSFFTESILKKSKDDPLKVKKTENSHLQNSDKEDKKLKSKAWYVLKDNNNYGPFTIVEIVQMLQAKVLYEFDFVWQSKFDGWKRVAEVPDFSAESIQSLLKSGNPEVVEYFFRRRNVRVNYGCSLVVHDNKQIYKGRSLELSSGGAGIYVDTNHFTPGQNLFLHFQPGDGVPPFNAICTVVSKQFTDNPQTSSAEYRYGVRFTSISQNIKQKIQEFAELDKKSKKKAS
jgi:hypothetical protein